MPDKIGRRPRPGHSQGSPARTWIDVVTTVQGYAREDPHWAPMRDFIERLAFSRYAGALYPGLSHVRLHLSQHPEISWSSERLTVEWEDQAFVVRYMGDLTAPVWTKRHPDGMVALERLFEHLGWFVEYQRHTPGQPLQPES
jgi:hypothetical protein